MTPKEIKTRQKHYEFVQDRIRSVQPSGTSNTLGTALYIAGEIPKDKFLHRYGSEHIFSNLQETENPEKGYLVAWFSEHITEGKAPFHAGVITHAKPLQVAERRRAQGDFNKSASFEEVDNFLRSSEEYLKTMNVKYFIPSKLQAILDQEGELK